MSNTPYLLDEPPISLYPSLAKFFGNANKAIVFQQLHFLLNTTRRAKNTHNFINGRWWVYNSYQQWREDSFTWLNESSIKRLFLELEKAGIVESMQSVKNPSDRRKWYTINYEQWAKLSHSIGLKSSDQPSDQNEPMVSLKSSDGYSETTSETTESAAPTMLNHTRKRKAPAVTHPLLTAYRAAYNEVLPGALAAPEGSAPAAIVKRLEALNATPEEVRAVVLAKHKINYPLAFVPDDLIVWRNEQAQIVPEPPTKQHPPGYMPSPFED